MNEKIVLIIPNEAKYNLPPYQARGNNHFALMMPFVQELGLNLDNLMLERKGGHGVACQLAENNCLVIHLDNKEKIMITYVPLIVSESQNKFLQRKASFFRDNYEYIGISDLGEDGNFSVIDSLSATGDIYDTLLEITSKKLAEKNLSVGR